ncbi:MAG: PGPGW domain-containing protein [Actinomycetota bacterium]
MVRIARIVGGILVIFAGILMLALPGPGILTIAAGVLILAKDIPAAERLVERVRARFARGDGTGDTAEESELA